MEPTPPTAQPPMATQVAPSRTTAIVVYVLYLLSFVTAGVTSIIGVVVAYVSRRDAPEPLASHYRFQIRTFWIGLLYGFVAFVLVHVVVGWLVFLLQAVWLVVRCVKGLARLERREPYPNVETWLW